MEASPTRGLERRDPRLLRRLQTIIVREAIHV